MVGFFVDPKSRIKARIENGYPCEVQSGASEFMEYRTERHYNPQDIAGLPPRKRMHHAMMPGFDVMNGAPLQTQNMSLQS